MSVENNLGTILDSYKERIEELEARLDEMDEMPVLGYQKLVPEAKLFKKHENDSCWDVFATSVQQEHGYIQYGTGLKFEIPEGYELKVYPRSSVSVTPLMLANSVGVVDEGYKGELFLRFKVIPGINTRRYDRGDRVGQIQLVKKTKCVAEELESVSSSERGSGGFGSTGKK